MQKRILKFYEWETVNESESTTNFSKISFGDGDYDEFLAQLGGTADNGQPLVYTDTDANQVPIFPPDPAKFVGITSSDNYGISGKYYSNKTDDSTKTEDDWGGSAIRALVLAKAAIKKSGVKEGYLQDAWIGSQKRDSRSVAGSSKNSDHHYENLDSYAVDIPVKNTLVGDKVFKALIDYFGGYSGLTKGGFYDHLEKYGKEKRLKKKNNKLEVEDGDYRYQFLWKVTGHYDHIHIGVKNTKGGKDPDKVNFSDDNKYYERNPEERIAPPAKGDYLVNQLERGFNPKDDPELFKHFKGYLQRLKPKGED